MSADRLFIGDTKYQFYRLVVRGIDPSDEYEAFHEDKRLLRMHIENREGRAIALPVLKKAVAPVLQKYLHQQIGSVIEGGCGDGFFYQCIAPSWLKARLISYDINTLSLVSSRKRDRTQSLFQGNTYAMSFAKGGLGNFIAYSSFDSLLWLEKALDQLSFSLRRGGYGLFFQDISTDLHSVGEHALLDSAERYHEELISAVEGSGSLRILEGREDYLEATVVENTDDILKRVTDRNIKRKLRRNPLVVAYRFGAGQVVPRMSLLPNRLVLREFGKHFRTQEKVSKTKVRSGQTLVWARLRYLVVQKTH